MIRIVRSVFVFVCTMLRISRINLERHFDNMYGFFCPDSRPTTIRTSVGDEIPQWVQRLALPVPRSRQQAGVCLGVSISFGSVCINERYMVSACDVLLLMRGGKRRGKCFYYPKGFPRGMDAFLWHVFLCIGFVKQIVWATKASSRGKYSKKGMMLETIIELQSEDGAIKIEMVSKHTTLHPSTVRVGDH